MGKTHHHVHHLLGIALLITAFSAQAAEPYDACANNQKLYQPPPIFSVDEREETRVSADQTEVLNSGISKFIGNVVIEQHELRLKADFC